MFACPVPKISQVKKKGRRRTSNKERDTLFLLHNSVDLLCGTTAAELNNPVSLMHAPGVAHIFQRQ